MIGDQTTDPLQPSVRPKLHWWADGKVEYKKDDIKDTESWQITEMFTPVYTKWGFGSPLPFFRTTGKIRYDLAAGLQYEDIFESDSAKDGDTLRATARGRT